MNSSNIIEVRDLTKIYGDLTVIKDLSFNVKKGEIFYIAGGSGCGKSTVLKQLIGLETPDSGEIYIDGLDYYTDIEKIKQNFGVLFQSGGLFASLTLAENIAAVYKKFTTLDEEIISDLIDMKLASVGLSGFRDYLPSEISG